MKEFDIAILGGGVTGLAAAVYSARFNMKTIVFGGRLGGLIQDTHLVENYPGFKSISGFDLSQNILNHAKAYPEQVTINEELVKDVEKTKDGFLVKGAKTNVKAKTILFATGTRRRKLNVPGEKEFANKGVSYCVTCDGPLFKGKKCIIIGGSDSAVKESLLLAEYASKVYIVYRKEKVHPEPINMKRAEELIKKGKIEIIGNTNVVEVKGDKFVSSVIFDKAYKGSKEFKCESVFIEIGHIVESELAKKLGVKLDEKGEIIINFDSKTNVAGVYAGGDVVARAWKQAIVGVAEGVLGVNSAYEYIQEQKVK
ncbi:MAG: FAD-dependent oxidoreductase [Candidatus Woesearchaeota archaeon]